MPSSPSPSDKISEPELMPQRDGDEGTVGSALNEAPQEWFLWIRHQMGGGWYRTRESCSRKSFKVAMRWADARVNWYDLHGIAYTVCLRDGQPSNGTKEQGVQQTVSHCWPPMD